MWLRVVPSPMTGRGAGRRAGAHYRTRGPRV